MISMVLRNLSSKTKHFFREVYETIKIVIQALILAIIVKLFFFQPFVIPSSSMTNTLLIGDYLFVSKYKYGYGPYSFSIGIPEIPTIGFPGFSFDVPVTEGRIWAEKPKRGDVAVFRGNNGDTKDYIKRVIGLPGDEIQMLSGVLHINGVPVKMKEVGSTTTTDKSGISHPAIEYIETLPNGVNYKILRQITSVTSGSNTIIYKVPVNHYFMMGDNRDGSEDSRRSLGYIPFKNFIGKAEIIWYSKQPGESIFHFWKWPSEIRWSRISSWIN